MFRRSWRSAHLLLGLLALSNATQGVLVKRQGTGVTSNTASQTVACSTVGTTTLNDAADASTLASACSTYTGSIALATGATGVVAFDGLEELQGSLSCDNVTQLTALTSDSLRTITNDLSIDGSTILNTFNFTQLGSVGNISIVSCPALQELSILQTLQTVSDIVIQNTQVQSTFSWTCGPSANVGTPLHSQIEDMEGFSISTVHVFEIANNPYMSTINLQHYNLTGSLIIQANGRNLAVSMPNMQAAQNMTFRNCSGISMPSITQINGSLGLYGNSIDSFNGAPLLQSVDGGLMFVSNPDMTNIALPELRSISGGFQVINNTNLGELDQLYSLQTIAGAVDLEGNFTNVTFPNVQDVRGSMHVESYEAMSCDGLDSLYQSNVIKGTYTCQTSTDQANLTRSSSPNSGGSASSSGSESGGNSTAATGAPDQSTSGSGLSKGARIGIGVGVGLGVGAVVGGLVAFFQVWWRKRQARNKKQHSDSELLPEADGAEIDRAVMLGNSGEKHELEQPTTEMPSGKAALAQELPAGHGETELGRSASTKMPPGVESRHEMPANETPPIPEERKE